MSAKKQTSLTSFFTPKPVKKPNSVPASVEVVNSSGKKRPPVFETPLAKKATVGNAYLSYGSKNEDCGGR
jgi:hypothetical protein